MTVILSGLKRTISIIWVCYKLVNFDSDLRPPKRNLNDMKSTNYGLVTAHSSTAVTTPFFIAEPHPRGEPMGTVLFNAGSGSMV
jgi:hypothetical protein